MRAPRSPRGFTLIELMVSIAVASFVIAGIFLAFYAQVKAYAGEQRQMSAQSGGREALDYLAQVIRSAGYGVDPSRAILAYDGFDPDSTTQTSADLAFPDALVVHSRDPDFQRGVSSASSGEVTFTSNAGKLYPGQILLLLCGGAAQSAYVTVEDQPEPNKVTLQAASEVTKDSPISWPGPQFHQEADLADPCFSRPDVVAVKVNRAAFFVRAFADDPAQPAALTPYLMLSQGLDLDDSGEVDLADAVPLAPNVEQLQLAYMMDAVPGQCATPAVHGVTDSPPWGTAWRTGTGPTMDTPYLDPSRCNNDVANVRQVRVTLVARAAHLGGSGGDDAFAPDGGVGKVASGATVWKPLENLTAPEGVLNPQGRGYQRIVLRLSAATQNLSMRSQFLPLTFGG